MSILGFDSTVDKFDDLTAALTRIKTSVDNRVKRKFVDSLILSIQNMKEDFVYEINSEKPEEDDLGE